MLQELIDLFKSYADESSFSTYIPYDYDLPDDVEYVDVQDVDSGRWESYHRTIVRYKGQLYAVEYSLGLTESQEDSFSPDKNSIYPVEHVVQTIQRDDYIAI